MFRKRLTNQLLIVATTLSLTWIAVAPCTGGRPSQCGGNLPGIGRAAVFSETSSPVAQVRRTDTRPDQTDAILGKWVAQFTTPHDDEIKVKFEVLKKGDQLMVKNLDDKKAKLQVATYEKKTLVFERVQPYLGMDLEFTFKLKLEENQIKGMLEYWIVGTETKGTIEEVSGKRLK